MRSIVGGGEIAGVKRNFKEGDSAGNIGTFLVNFCYRIWGY